MLSNRKFNVVVVKNGRGVGIDLSANPDRVIEYAGQAKAVSLGISKAENR
jgi:hypothetical protein